MESSPVPATNTSQMGGTSKYFPIAIVFPMSHVHCTICEVIIIVFRFAKEFRVPPGFVDVLRNLTREVLRNNQEGLDINKFGNQLICF